MSFDVMRKQPPKKGVGLRADWSTEEAKFQAGLADFVKSVEDGNPVLDNPSYAYDPEKIPSPEVVTKPEVPKEPEKIPKIMQDAHREPVESIIVREANVASETMQPTRPAQQESVLNTSEVDPFDEVESSIPQKENKQDSGDDFFDVLEGSTIQQPKQSAAPQAPATVKTTAAIDAFDAIEETVANELPKTSAKSASAPSVAPASAPAVKASSSTEKAQTVKSVVSAASKPHGESKLAAEAMEGFDFQRFDKVMETVNRITDGLPRVELDRILNSAPEFSVSMELDHQREDPNVLTDRLCEIQSKRDSLHSLTLYLTPLVCCMKQAADYLESAGIGCSSASSREKRIAQIKLQQPEFYVRYSDVLRASETVDRTFMKLQEQYETISRCITLLQIKTKIGEVARGPEPFVPFDPPYKTIQAPAQAAQAAKPPVPQGTIATGKAPQNDADDDFLNRQFSQPVTNMSQKKFENLETFKTGLKADKKTTGTGSVGGTQETDW